MSKKRSAGPSRYPCRRSFRAIRRFRSTSSVSKRMLVLVTNGMSSRAMKVPRGKKQNQYAELAINLPLDWPLTAKALEDRRTTGRSSGCARSRTILSKTTLAWR